MAYTLLVLWLAFALMPLVTVGDHVLFVTIAGYSAAHQMSSTARELLTAHPEHTVTFVAYEPYRELVLSKHAKIQFVPWTAKEHFPSAKRDEVNALFDTNNLKGLGTMMSLLADHYDEEINLYASIVKANRPDLVVIDFFVASAYDFMAFHRIEYVTFYHTFALGILNIEDTFATPDAITGTTLAQRSFLDRLRRVWGLVEIVIATSEAGGKLGEARARHSFPAYLAPETNIVIKPIIAMTSFAVEYARKMNPLTRIVGFFHEDAPQMKQANTPSDQSVLKFLAQDPTAPAIYAAFGSEHVSTKHQIVELVQGVKATRMRLILVIRSSVQDSAGISSSMLQEIYAENVLVVPWVTQQFILAQPQITVFITHGGAASIGEAIYATKPMIVIAAGADRMATSARIVDKGAGLRLNLKTFTRNDVTKAIDTIQQNHSQYAKVLKWMVSVNEHAGGGARGAAVEIANILQDGSAHLVPVEWDLGWFAASGADLVAFLVLTQLALVYFVFKLTKRMCC